MPDHTIRQKIKAKQVPFYPDQLIKPTPRLPVIKTQDYRRMTLDLDLDTNKDFEENSPYQEGIISETYQRPDKSQLQEPLELVDLINTNNLVQKYSQKTNRNRQNFENHTKKGVEKHTSPCNHKGDTGGIFKQPIFQRYIPIFSTK